MIKPKAVVLCVAVAIPWQPLVAQDPVAPHKLRSVSGFLDAHWEYPNFLPDKGTRLKTMPFSIREELWRKTYAKPVNEAYIQRPSETICFRVIGRGFVAPREPSFMQPWKGEQFVFVRISKLVQLSTDRACAARMKPNGS